jgi:hypothetical protein
MDRALTIFMYLWGGLILLANVLGIVAQFGLHGFGGGMFCVQEIYSPFNVTNYGVTLVMLSPAIGAYFWREKRLGKRGLQL